MRKLYFLVIFLMAVFLAAVPAIAQVRPQPDALQRYERGEIDAETAILEQFRTAFNRISLKDDDPQTIKCLTPALMMLEQHRAEISAPALQEISSYLSQNAVTQSSDRTFVSASGRFGIQYDITGEDAVPPGDTNQNGIPDYVEWAAEAADSSYRHEIQTIGFINPIPEGYRYSIILSDLGAGGSGLYGYTETTGDPNIRTVIYIDNDFADDYPPNTDPEGDQKGSLEVTVAHELKHAIQYEANFWRNPSGSYSWSEMDATLMEEIVFDDVNDYYNYIKQDIDSELPNSYSIFGNPQNSVPGSYNYITWMLYYAEAHGMEIWKNVWDLIQANNYLGFDEGLAEELPLYGTTFEESLVRNQLWHFASGPRAPGGYGFEERFEYPEADVEESYAGIPTLPDSVAGIDELAARYYEFVPSANDQGIIEVGLNVDSAMVGLGVLVYANNGQVKEYVKTGNDIPQLYQAVDYTWDEVERLGVVIANTSMDELTGKMSLVLGKNGSRFKITDPCCSEKPEEISLYQNYPNPFNPETTIEFDLPVSAEVVLEVYNVTGRKVRTLTEGNRLAGNYKVRFNADNLASGVYFYRLAIGDYVLIKKMTLIK